MEDRHLCKAKRTDNGEWVEGYYFCMVHTDGRHAHHFIIPLGADLSLGIPIEKIQVEVDPSTLCQCTGLKDKNGKLIWEDDIVKVSTNKGNTLCEVRYADNVAQFQLWQFTTLPRTATVLNLGNYEEKVIGNIYDNPSLLEGGAE